MLLLVLFLTFGNLWASPIQNSTEKDDDASRKILGSSVVTSVSVIMNSDTDSGTYFADAVGKPVSKPQTGAQLASPIDLLNPDRYEFFTFDDNGELVKRLMTLDEIQSIIANGDGEDAINSEMYLPEKKVNDIVNTVQNVLKQEIKSHKNNSQPPILDTPDVSSSWSMILPAIFGNSGEDITPEKVQTMVTPETIMIENVAVPKPTQEIFDLSKFETHGEELKPIYINVPETENKKPEKPDAPAITVEIVTNKQDMQNIDIEIEAVKNVERIPINKKKPNITAATTTQSSNFELIQEVKPTLATVTKITKNPTTKPTNIRTTTTTSTTERVKIEEIVRPIQTTTEASDILNSTINTATLLEEVKEETTISIATEVKPLTLRPALTTTPRPSSVQINYGNYDVKVQNSSTASPIILSSYDSSKTQTEGTKIENFPESFSTKETITEEPLNLEITEANVTDEPLDEIEEDTENKSPESLSTVAEIQTTTLSSLSSEGPLTTKPTSAKTTTLTTPILFIIRQNVTPETSTNGFLSTFFFIDDRNKHKHQTTYSPVETKHSFTPTDKVKTTESSQSHEQFTSDSSKLTTKLPVEDSLQRLPATELPLVLIGDENTTTHVNIERITENSANDASKRPVIFDMQDLSEDEETKEVPEKNEQVTSDPIKDQVTELSSQDVTKDFASSVESAIEVTTRRDSVNSTTENPVTSNKQGVTEALGQFLLSSTNIYEINSQLVDLTNNSQDGTTQASLISSIEQMISQAITNEEKPVFNIDDTKKVEEMLENTKDKPMKDIQAEIATIASVLLDDNSDDTDALLDENLQLSEAVDSLLSQVSETQPTSLPSANSTVESLEVNINSASASDELNSNNTVEEIVELNKISSTEKTFELNSTTESEDSDEKSSDNIDVPEKVYEEIDIQKIMDEIELTNSDSITNNNNNNEVPPSNKDELTKNKTEVINVNRTEIVLTENSKNQTYSEPDVQKVTSEDNSSANEGNIIKIKTENNSNTSTAAKTEENASISDDQLNQSEKINSTNVEITSMEEILETIVSPLNSTNPEIIIQNVSNIYDIITSTAKYDFHQSQLISTTSNIVKTITNLPGSGSNYKMEVVTEMPSTTTTTTNKIQPSKNNIKNPSEEEKNSTWTLVPTVLPHSNLTFVPAVPKPPLDHLKPPTPVKLSPHPVQGFGLEDSTSRLDTDIYQFVELCNELAFGFWSAVTTGISSVRSVFVSPFAATSLLAMVFLGARGATSGEMNEILKLDDMVTFNPHLIFKNVSESIEVSKSTGIAASVIARELFSDRSKGKLLSFYKDRAKQFYDGHVEEVYFKEIGDIIRRRTNLLVKKYTWGKIQEYVKDSSITVRPPLAGVSASVFQTDCSSTSTHGRDGELYFVVLPSVRQRRLIPIPAAVWRTGFLAGYDPSLDATAAAIGTQDQTVSVIFVIPGQQGVAAPGDGLTRLEKRLVDSSFKQGSWSRLLRSLIPRPGLELQIPRFSHKSVINATVALKNMGLKDLFSYEKADLKGLNGASHELHLSDILQINNFVMCGEVPIGENHHVEIYPATAKRPSRRSRKLEYKHELRLYSDAEVNDEPRDYQRAFNDPLHNANLLSLPLSQRPRQARIPDAPRLRFDRPFLFFVRHNPTGLILHMGRFNPRLLP